MSKTSQILAGGLVMITILIVLNRSPEPAAKDTGSAPHSPQSPPDESQSPSSELPPKPETAINREPPSD